MQEDKEKLLQLGAKLKKVRKSRKLTLESVCYKNGLEPSTLSRIEQGAVDPKYLTLAKIINALNIKMKDIFEE